MPTIKGKLIFASVAEDDSGIHLRIATDLIEATNTTCEIPSKLEVAFLPVNEKIGELSLILKEGMDAREEMQKVCDLLNGYKTEKDGRLTQMFRYEKDEDGNLLTIPLNNRPITLEVQ